MSGPGMNYPGFQGQLPNFSSLNMALPWMNGPTAAPGGNTIMGMNPPGGPMPGTGPGFAQGGPIQGGPTMGTGMGGPTTGNQGPGAGTYHIINPGPQTGTGQMGPGTGGNTGGNIDWHHILGVGGLGDSTGGSGVSPLARAILGSRYGTPTPGNRFNIA